MRGAGKLRGQARWAALHALFLTGKAEVEFLRGGQQANGDGLGQIPVKLSRGMGHSGLALHYERNQGMRSAIGRPGALVRAQEPDSVSGEARRFGRTGNQNRRVLGLGGK